MSEAEVRRILQRIAPETDPAWIDTAQLLQSELDIDSFDFLNLRVAVRDELGVSAAESDHDKVLTLDDMVRVLAAML